MIVNNRKRGHKCVVTTAIVLAEMVKSQINGGRFVTLSEAFKIYNGECGSLATYIGKQATRVYKVMCRELRVSLVPHQCPLT